MKRVKNMPDRRQELDSICTVANWEVLRTQNLQDGYWACVCGSRKFHLRQDTENVKAECCKCGNSDIIYWNGQRDRSSGRMKRLDANCFVSGKQSSR